MATTPNMGLNVTVQGSTPGPTYATYVDQNETIVDNHDHTVGKGLKITPAAMNINADLSMNSHNLTNLPSLTVTGKIQGGTYNDWSSIYALSTATGDGVTNDAAQFNIATAAIVAAGGGTLLLPRGTYFINTNITVPKGCGLVFLSGASLKIATGITVTILDGIQAAQNQQLFQTTSSDNQPVKFGNPGTLAAKTSGPMFVYPQWFGAKADGSTDDWAAIQQCIFAFGYNPNPIPLASGLVYGSGGTIYFPLGQYNISKTIRMGLASSGLTLLGATRGQNSGQSGTVLNFTAIDGSDGLQIGGETITSPASQAATQLVDVGNMLLQSGSSGGVPLHLYDAKLCTFHHLSIGTGNLAKNSVWLNGGVSNGNVSNIDFQHCLLNPANGAFTAAILQIDGGGQPTVGQCSEISFQDIEFNGTMTALAPQVQINANVAGGIGCQNIRFEQCRFEVPFGGAVHNFGALNVSLRHCTAGDTGGTNNAPLIKLRKGAASNQLPNGFCIDQFWSDIGNATANQASLDFDNNNAGQASISVIDSQLQYLNGGTNSPTGPPVLLLNSFLATGFTGNPPCSFATVSNGDGLSGLGGISATQTPSRNLGGTLIIPSGTNTVTVTLPVSESDALYQVAIGPPYGVALPVAGSNRLQRITKTTTTFTVVTEVNTGQNQSYDWWLFRA